MDKEMRQKAKERREAYEAKVREAAERKNIAIRAAEEEFKATIKEGRRSDG